MRDLSFAHAPFPEGSHGLESHDPGFLKVVDLAQQSKFTEAADEIEALHAEKAFDARLASYYLYECFAEGGCRRLAEVFDALAALVTRSWEPVIAAQRAPAVLNRSVAWFLQTLLHSVEYHQTNADATWRRWVEGVGDQELANAVASAERLNGVLTEPVFHQSIELMGRALRWVRELRVSLAAPPVAEAASPQSEPVPATSPATSPAVLALPGQSFQLQGSAKLAELIQKLKAFELLVEKRSFQRAALVGDDVMATLEAFDPRDYFPELFSRFGALMSEFVGEISPHWDQKNSVQWKALSQFYKVDLRRFVED